MLQEGVDRIVQRGGSRLRLQSLAVYDVDLLAEESGNVVRQSDIVIDPKLGLPIDVDVDVASGLPVSARRRAEERSMPHALFLQVGGMLPKDSFSLSRSMSR